MQYALADEEHGVFTNGLVPKANTPPTLFKKF